MNSIVREYFPALDLMKFFMALMIMFAHISSENVSINPWLKMIFSLYNVGVPFFFSCSGYLFFLKFKKLDKKERFKEYIDFSKRIGLMYLVWSAIYFCFVLANWIMTGVNFSVILKYFHHAFVFSTYGTIWFLPALWVGMSITFYLLYKNKNIKIISIIAILLYIIGLLGYSYTKIIDGVILKELYYLYKSIFVTTRNGLFYGFPFVFLGAYVALYSTSEKQTFNFMATLIFVSLFVGESFFIRHNRMGVDVGMGIMLLPAIFFMMKWLINSTMKSHISYVWMRKMSMLIFLGQRLFISAIPSVLPAAIVADITRNAYVGLVIYACSVLIFSALVVKLSDRYKWLKILW